MQRRLLLSTLGTLPVLGACAAATTTTTMPPAARADSAAGLVSLTRVPQRVAVYDLGVLDTLLALGVKPVGLPGGHWPAYLQTPATQGAVRVGTLFEPDLDALRATRPDLILVGGRSAAKAEALEAIAPTLDLSTSTRAWVPSVLQNLLLLGRLFDRQAQAATLAEQLLAQQRALHRQSAALGSGLLLFATAGGLAAQAAHSRFGGVYELAGLDAAVSAADLPAPRARNANANAAAAPEPAAAREAQAQRARQAAERDVQLSAVLDAHRPDWLFVLDRPAATGGAAVAPGLLRAQAGIQRSSAWQRQRVITLDAPTWYLVGGGFTAQQNSMRQFAAAFAKA